MVKVLAQGKTFYCDRGANLRELLENNINLYNGGATIINCPGIGTCAVQVAGISAVNWRFATRRSLPPHSPTRNLHLACQTQVLGDIGDISVTKFDLFGVKEIALFGARQD